MYFRLYMVYLVHVSDATNYLYGQGVLANLQLFGNLKIFSKLIEDQKVLLKDSLGSLRQLTTIAC